MRKLHTLALLVALLAASAFTTQPMDERTAQNALPQSHDSLWAVFAKCKVTSNHQDFTYSIVRTAEVEALEGKELTIQGFMLPLEAKDKFTHYLLSKRTPTCGFCPPGEPNEVVEVFSDKPVAWEEGMVAVTGTMAFTDNAEKGLFFQLKNAKLAK